MAPQGEATKRCFTRGLTKAEKRSPAASPPRWSPGACVKPPQPSPESSRNEPKAKREAAANAQNEREPATSTQRSHSVQVDPLSFAPGVSSSSGIFTPAITKWNFAPKAANLKIRIETSKFNELSAFLVSRKFRISLKSPGIASPSKITVHGAKAPFCYGWGKNSRRAVTKDSASPIRPRLLLTSCMTRKQRKNDGNDPTRPEPARSTRRPSLLCLERSRV